MSCVRTRAEDDFDKYRLLSKRNLSKNKALSTGTTTIDDGSIFYLMHLAAISDKDNYTVLIIASEVAWEAYEEGLREVMLSFDFR